MESLGNLESFVRSAEAGSFAAAARALGMSSAAVSKNVARLEKNLGVLLFHRNTRSLTLTEAGRDFLREVSSGLETIEHAVANLSGSRTEDVSGVLRITLPVGFGFEQILRVIAAFKKKHPKVIPELHFENRRVDLIGEGFDVAIGGAVDLNPSIVARELTRIHVVALAAPSFVKQNDEPARPADLEKLPAIVMRSPSSGRVWSVPLQNESGEEERANLTPSIIVNDPEAMCRCAMMGLGVTVAPLTQATPYLERGDLVRLLPGWYADIGAFSVYVSSNRLLPLKTRAFIDFVADWFKRRKK